MAAHAATALGQGMVTLEDGTLQVDADGFSNTILSLGASCLEVTEGHVLELKATVLSEGTLTLRGTYDVSALTSSVMGDSYVDAEQRVGTSGFATTGGFSVTVISGGTVQGDDAVIIYGNETLTLGANGIATAAGSTDYGTYYLTDTLTP